MAQNGNGRRGGAHFASSAGEGRRPSATRRQVADAARQADSSAADAALGEVSTPAAVSPETAQALETLAPGQGAVVTTRSTAAEAADAARSNYQEMGTGSFRLTGANRPMKPARTQSKLDPKKIAIIAAAAALMVAVIFFVVTRLLGGSRPKEEEGPKLIEETQVGTSVPVEYGGYSYQVVEKAEGGFAFTRLAAGSNEPLVIADLPGTPVGLVLGGGAFYIPENLGGSWDVITYTLGEGAVPGNLMDADGNAVSGEGSITAASYENGNLMLTLESGEVRAVAAAL